MQIYKTSLTSSNIQKRIEPLTTNWLYFKLAHYFHQNHNIDADDCRDQVVHQEVIILRR